ALGLEAAMAEARGVPLAVAVRDLSQFPYLFQLHVGITDMLTKELPPELRTLAERLMALDLPGLRGFNGTLAQLAMGAAGDAERGAARVFLYEAVRVALVVTTWSEMGG